MFSGCVTSAETVLIQEQSYEKLLIQLNIPRSRRPLIAVAISPNSRASIAHFLNMDPSECFLRIATVLKSIGVTYVLDLSSGGDVALVEGREEFLRRYSLKYYGIVSTYKL
jgi:iron only hydrogenase large subunit-like protein